MSKAGLYFHIPFCLKKCAYCDFCSFTGKTDGDMRMYASALVKEMEHYAKQAENTVFDTVFFGGGTPSLLPTDVIAHILNKANTLFSIEKDAEITLEANPATADFEKLSALRRIGINRLSVGVQSLVDRELAFLGRLHTSRDALDFLHASRQAGFENINVDLMYGIPAQTEASARETLSRVLDFAPSHISAYSLMLEEGTPLYRQKEALPLPSEEDEDAIDATVRDTLRANGYEHYEISNYARPGMESRHNLHYWRSDEYLGFGVTAYSFFNGARYGNGADLAAYLADPTASPADCEVLEEDALAYEWIMLRLRLKEGLSLLEYRARFGVDLKVRYQSEIESFIAAGLMREERERISLTESGFRLSNTVLVAFLPDEKNC